MSRWDCDEVRDFWVLAFESESHLHQATAYLAKENTPQKWEQATAVPLNSEGAGTCRWYAVCGAIVSFGLLSVWALVTQFEADPLITQGRVQGVDMWIAYVVPVFECLILGAGVGSIVGFLKKAGLPRWYDRVNECEFFTMNDDRGFYLLLERGEDDERLLQQLNPVKQVLIKKEEES